jgi:hypothetical protein
MKEGETTRSLKSVLSLGMAAQALPVKFLKEFFSKLTKYPADLQVLPMNEKGDKISRKQLVKMMYKGLFGLNADFMFRMLVLSDKPMSDFFTNIELYNKALKKGLKPGTEAFDKYINTPSKEVLEQARQRGLMSTFQQEGKNVKAMMYILNSMSKYPAADFILKSQLPYRKTPMNILSNTLKMAVPGWALATAGASLAKGDMRKFGDDLSMMVIGQTVQYFTLYLMANGMLTPPVDWGDEEDRAMEGSQFGGGKVNLSAIKRALAGENPEYREDDFVVAYERLGLLGILMGGAVMGMTVDEASEEWENAFSAENIMSRTLGFSAVKNVNAMLNQSFLTGLSSLMTIFSASSGSRDLEYAWQRWVTSTSESMGSAFLPNNLRTMNKSFRAYQPDRRLPKDSDMMDGVLNDIKYSLNEKLFNTFEDYPPKVSPITGEPLLQTPGGDQTTLKRVMYQSIDLLKVNKGDPKTNWLWDEIIKLKLAGIDRIDVLGFPSWINSRTVKFPSQPLVTSKGAFSKYGRGLLRKIRDVYDVDYSNDDFERDFSFFFDEDFVRIGSDLNPNVPSRFEVTSDIEMNYAQSVMPQHLNTFEKAKQHRVKNNMPPLTMEEYKEMMKNYRYLHERETDNKLGSIYLTVEEANEIASELARSRSAALKTLINSEEYKAMPEDGRALAINAVCDNFQSIIEYENEEKKFESVNKYTIKVWEAIEKVYRRRMKMVESGELQRMILE